MAVLITGASGFIGWHLSRALCEQGRIPRALVRKTSKADELKALGVELVYGDVTDASSMRDAMRDVDRVFHLAGLTKALSRDALDRVNVEGSRNVAAACAEQGVETLICVSSLAAAGPSLDGSPLDERCEPQPVSDYGRSKLAGEHAVREYCEQVPTSIVRPPIVIGEFDPASLEMFKSISRMRVHMVPGFRARPFSIIHAEDLVALLLAIEEKGERIESADPSKGVYFAECESRPTYAEIGDLIASSIGRKCLKIPVASSVLRVFGTAADMFARMTGKSLYFSSDKVREANSGPWICSAQKARSQFGFQPQASISDRFLQSGRWYLERGWL